MTVPSRVLNDLFSKRAVASSEKEKISFGIEEWRQWRIQLLAGVENRNERRRFRALCKKVDAGDPEARRRLEELYDLYAGQDYVVMRLREVSFCRKVMPPQRVDPPMLKNRDLIRRLVDLPPQSKAIKITFRKEDE